MRFFIEKFTFMGLARWAALIDTDWQRLKTWQPLIYLSKCLFAKLTLWHSLAHQQHETQAHVEVHVGPLRFALQLSWWFAAAANLPAPTFTTWPDLTPGGCLHKDSASYKLQLGNGLGLGTNNYLHHHLLPLQCACRQCTGQCCNSDHWLLLTLI